MAKIKTIYPEYFRSKKDGHWYLRIRSRNGNQLIKASEGDGYNRKSGVLNLISILSNCKLAPAKEVSK